MKQHFPHRNIIEIGIDTETRHPFFQALFSTSFMKAVAIPLPFIPSATASRWTTTKGFSPDHFPSIWLSVTRQGSVSKRFQFPAQYISVSVADVGGNLLRCRIRFIPLLPLFGRHFRPGLMNDFPYTGKIVVRCGSERIKPVGVRCRFGHFSCFPD